MLDVNFIEMSSKFEHYGDNLDIFFYSYHIFCDIYCIGIFILSYTIMLINATKCYGFIYKKLRQLRSYIPNLYWLMQVVRLDGNVWLVRPIKKESLKLLILKAFYQMYKELTKFCLRFIYCYSISCIFCLSLSLRYLYVSLSLSLCLSHMGIY